MNLLAVRYWLNNSDYRLRIKAVPDFLRRIIRKLTSIKSLEEIKLETDCICRGIRYLKDHMYRGIKGHTSFFINA